MLLGTTGKSSFARVLFQLLSAIASRDPLPDAEYQGPDPPMIFDNKNCIQPTIKDFPRKDDLRYSIRIECAGHQEIWHPNNCD